VAVPAGPQALLDVLPTETQTWGTEGWSLCEKCLRPAPTAHIILHQHVGAVLLMFHKHIDANLCRECLDKTYNAFQAKTLALGWWGVASLVIAPFCLMLDGVRYNGVSGVPWAAGPTVAARAPETVGAPQATRASPRALLLPPAIILCVVSVLGLLGSLLLFGINASSTPEATWQRRNADRLKRMDQGKEPRVPLPEPGTPEAAEAIEKIRQTHWEMNLLYAVQGLLSLAILAGAVQMLRVQSWWLCLTSSLLASLPFVGPCCCLGVPFGIWSSIVLCLPGVRAAFAPALPLDT